MPGDIARLVIEIDSNGVVTGKAALEGLTDAGKKAEDQNKKHRASLTELNQGLEIARKAFDLLKGAVVDSVAEFMDAEKAQVKLEAVLRATGQAAGRTAQDLNNMANTLAGKTIFDDDTITNAQALMLTFKNVGGEIYDRTIPAVLDLSSAFGMDLAGASVMLGKALEDPTSGLTALRRVGVSFTDQQENEIKVLAAAGEAAKAQGEILDVLKGQVGGVAEAMGASASGSIARMENAVNNLKEAFGRLIATNFQPLIDGMTHAMDVASGTKISVEDLVGGNPGQWRGKVNGASEAQLGFMVQDINADKERPWFRAGTDLGNALRQLESLVLGRIDELKKAGKYGNSEAGKAYDPLSEFGPINWKGSASTPSPWVSGFNAGEFTPFVDLEAKSQAYIGKGALGGVDSGLEYGPSATTKEEADILRDTKKALDDVDRALIPFVDENGRLAAAMDHANLATKEWDDSMGRLNNTLKFAGDQMERIAAQNIAQGFQDIGAAMATGASAGDAFGQAMLRMGVQVMEQIGGLLIADGLKMLLETSTLNPMGWAMIAAGGGLEMAGGALGASMKSDNSGPRSALSASSSSSSSSQAPAQVTVNNYAGVQVTTTERQGPSGKELQIAIRAAVAGEIAGGGLDRVMTQRYGVQAPGRSAS